MPPLSHSRQNLVRRFIIDELFYSKTLIIICVEQLSTNNQCNTAVDQLVSEYDDQFQGLDKLGKVKLHIDDTVKTIAQPQRRIPFHVRKELEQELKRDEELCVLESVEGSTPWVSPRVCVDMRQANEAIVRVC